MHPASRRGDGVLVLALPAISKLALARIQLRFLGRARADLPAAAGVAAESGDAVEPLPLHGPSRVEVEHNHRAEDRAGAAVACRYAAARRRALDLLSGNPAAASRRRCAPVHARSAL